MKETSYKLGEYKIIESDTGELRWESHFGLGALQEGRCFRKGTILFMGPAESRHDGFLKLEFVDHLKGFPDWLKTKYYCENLDVFHCMTGKRVTREEMRSWMFGQDRRGKPPNFPAGAGEDSNDPPSLMSRENVAFRLQTYEIDRKANGQVVWNACEGLSSLGTGACIILEDILFMGPWQDEQTNVIKREFLENLKQLPVWTQTKYYCPRFSLRECESVNRIREKRKGWKRRRRVKEPHEIGNEYKNITEFKVPGGTQREIFSGKISPVLGSLADSAARCYEKRAWFFRFKFKKSYVTKGIAVFRASGIRKWITYAVALFFLILSSFFTFLIGPCDEHRERSHDQKGEHSSRHHGDH